MQITVCPIPVLTTEQYWALLFTTSTSLFSMYSLGVSPQVLGSVASVSNLYPDHLSAYFISLAGKEEKLRYTPELHHFGRNRSPPLLCVLLLLRRHFVLVILFNVTISLVSPKSRG